MASCKKGKAHSDAGASVRTPSSTSRLTRQRSAERQAAAEAAESEKVTNEIAQQEAAAMEASAPAPPGSSRAPRPGPREPGSEFVSASASQDGEGRRRGILLTPRERAQRRARKLQEKAQAKVLAEAIAHALRSLGADALGGTGGDSSGRAGADAPAASGSGGSAGASKAARKGVSSGGGHPGGGDDDDDDDPSSPEDNRRGPPPRMGSFPSSGTSTPRTASTRDRAARMQGLRHKFMDPTVPRPNVPLIPKFSGTGWDVWCIRFEAWAVAQKLWEYYEESIPRPADPDPAADEDDFLLQLEEQQRHDNRMARAYDCLLSAMDKPEHIRLLAEFRSKQGAPPRVHEAWVRLKTCFQRMVASTYFNNVTAMTTLKMKEGESVLVYWARAKELRDRCFEVGFWVDDELWFSAVLRGLPRSYKGIVQNQTQDMSKLVDGNLLQVLLEEEDSQKQYKGKSHDSDALPADGKSKAPRGREQGSKGKGPERDLTPKRLGPDGAWGELGSAPRDHCHGCHKPGHFWEECPRRPEGAIPKHWRGKGQGKATGKGKGAANPAESGHSDDEDGADLLLVAADAAAGEQGQSDEDWILDSGASYNFTPFASDFVNPMQPPLTDRVRVGDGTWLPVTGMGDVWVRGAGGRPTRLSKVHLVPGMHSRLLSVPHLQRAGVEVSFKGGKCQVIHGTEGRVMMEGRQQGGHIYGLFRITLPPCPPPAQEHIPAQAEEAAVSMEVAHKRLAHVSTAVIKKLLTKAAGTGLKVMADQGNKLTCAACQLGKVSRLPFPQSTQHSVTHPLHKVSADLWGPARTPTIGKHSVYVLSLLDHWSSYVWNMLLPNKQAVTIQHALSQWLAQVERHSEHKLKVLLTDNGTEFRGEVDQWLRSLGVQRQYSAPYSPQQNGKVERWHRSMGEGVRTLLLDSGLPLGFWGEALGYFTQVKNMCPHSALPAGLTPFERWTGRKPVLSMLRPWGCMATSLLPDQAREGKLQTKGVLVVHLGIDPETKGWRVLDPSSGRVFVSRNLQFMEGTMWKDWHTTHASPVLGVSTAAEVLGLVPDDSDSVYDELDQTVPEPSSHEGEEDPADWADEEAPSRRVTFASPIAEHPPSPQPVA